MTEKKTGIEKELAELRAEIYEARNLVIKSDNLLRTLHAEVKAVGKTQERFEGRHFVSSVAAYAIFALLAAGAAFWIVQATLGPARDSADEAIAAAAERVAAAEASAATAREALSARQVAEREATAVYEGLASEDPAARRAALDALDRLDVSQIPEVLRRLLVERAADLRHAMVRDAWDRGRRAYLAERMEEAAEALDVVVGQRAHLGPDFEPAIQAQAAYYLGAARNRLGAHGEAVRVLRLYVEDANAPRNTLAYAHLLLGDSLEQSAQADAARAAFQSGLEAEPGGRHAQVLRRRLDRLADGQPATPAAPAPGD
jgi:hypothetical protein